MAFALKQRFHFSSFCNKKQGQGKNSKLGAVQNPFEELETQKLGAKNLYFLYSGLIMWVRKCAPLRTRLQRPLNLSQI